MQKDLINFEFNKFNKQRLKLGDIISKRKIRTHAKIPEKSSGLQKKKKKQENDVQRTSETNSSTFPDTKRSEEHIRYALL